MVKTATPMPATMTAAVRRTAACRIRALARRRRRVILWARDPCAVELSDVLAGVARLQRAAEAAFRLDNEMSEIREEIKEAQTLFSQRTAQPLKKDDRQDKEDSTNNESSDL